MRTSFGGVLLGIALVTAIVAPAAGADPHRATGSDASLAAELTDHGARLSRHQDTGLLAFVTGTRARPAASAASLGGPPTPEAAARAFMARYGSLFGVRDAASELTVARISRDGRGRSFVRYQQVHAGVPVIAGELIVQVDANRNVISANGEASADASAVDVLPAIKAAAAAATARASVAKLHHLTSSRLVASAPQLAIYDPALLGGHTLPMTRLVWQTEVTAHGADFREFVLVDARRGELVLHFDQNAEAKNRLICNANNADANRVGPRPAVTTRRMVGSSATGMPPARHITSTAMEPAIRTPR